MSDLDCVDWGHLPYREAWERQKELLRLRIDDKITDTLIFCEHDPIITLGRGTVRAGTPIVRDAKIEVLEIERGGLATYHGPGQMVVYPIFKLARKRAVPGRTGVVDLIRHLEKWVIEYLATQNLVAHAPPGKTGVWVGEKKVASIGIAVSHWVSYHGLALNFATGLTPWQSFDPCGFDSSVMSDLNILTKRAKPYTYAEVRDGLRKLAAGW